MAMLKNLCINGNFDSELINQSHYENMAKISIFQTFQPKNQLNIQKTYYLIM